MTQSHWYGNVSHNISKLLLAFGENHVEFSLCVPCDVMCKNLVSDKTPENKLNINYYNFCYWYLFSLKFLFES